MQVGFLRSPYFPGFVIPAAKTSRSGIQRQALLSASGFRVRR
jgi:hypothetical protein